MPNVAPDETKCDESVFASAFVVDDGDDDDDDDDGETSAESRIVMASRNVRQRDGRGALDNDSRTCIEVKEVDEDCKDDDDDDGDDDEDESSEVSSMIDVSLR